MKKADNDARDGLDKETFRDGKLRENGKPLQVGRFKNGQQVGLWKRYHESGKLYDVGKYVNGEKRGVWKYYDKRGKLIRTKTL